MTHKWNTDFASDKPEHVRRQGVEGEPAMSKLSDRLTPAQCITELQHELAEARAREDDTQEAIRAVLNVLPCQKNPHPDDDLQKLVNLAVGLLQDALHESK